MKIALNKQLFIYIYIFLHSKICTRFDISPVDDKNYLSLFWFRKLIFSLRFFFIWNDRSLFIWNKYFIKIIEKKIIKFQRLINWFNFMLWLIKNINKIIKQIFNNVINLSSVLHRMITIYQLNQLKFTLRCKLITLIPNTSRTLNRIMERLKHSPLRVFILQTRRHC